MLDDLLGAVGQRVRPRAEPAAEGLRRLEQRDGHTALGQHHRGAHARDPAPDDHRLGAGRRGPRAQRVGGHQHARTHAQGSGAGVPRSTPSTLRTRVRGMGARRAGLAWHGSRTRQVRHLAAFARPHPGSGRRDRGGGLRRHLGRRLSARRSARRRGAAGGHRAHRGRHGHGQHVDEPGRRGGRVLPPDRRRRTRAVSCSASGSATPRRPPSTAAPTPRSWLPRRAGRRTGAEGGSGARRPRAEGAGAVSPSARRVRTRT